MKHLFRATKMGWKEEKEGVWFDSDVYSKEKAQADIEQQKKDALADSKNDVADLSIEIASKIIKKSLNADDQKALIDSYIEGLGNNESN